MKKKIICIFVMTLLIVTVSPAVGMTYVFPSNNSLIEKTGAEDYMMTNWYERQKLVASAGTTADGFGISVSIDGDYAIIGSPWDDANGFFSGSAYIFTRSGTTWTKQAKLLASDGAAGDWFGVSVSIDGDYAIIGADGDRDNGVESGSAYVFKRDGTSWTQEDKLIASDGEADDWFGRSVSIDGDYVIIGALYDDDNGNNSGSAYVFKRDGTSWTQEDKLIASDGETDDHFGYTVSIDGDYAIVGARWDDDNGDNSGSAYVFKRDGTSWTEQARLLASDGADFDLFGCSVSIDGDYAIIGAERDDSSRGSAYIFKRTGTSWAEEDKLTASGGATGDSFGFSVSIEGDYAIIGAPRAEDNGFFSGSAYVFKRDGANWNEQAKLLASDGATSDYFGRSVSIDGDYAIIGADGDDSSYVFKRDGTNWNEQDKLLDSYGAYSNTLLLRLLEQFPFLERLFNLIL